MNPPRARIVRDERVEGAPLYSLAPPAVHCRRVVREELEARLAAERITSAARAQADEIVSRARDQAAGMADQVSRDAREEGEARLATRWLRLRQEDAARLARDTDRIISVAVVLAERILGESLQLDPSRIVGLARVAIDEARGARRILVEAHPLDTEVLRMHLGGAGLGEPVTELRADDTLCRGELRLQTDIGTIDAKLSPRLDRLAGALRDALP